MKKFALLKKGKPLHEAVLQHKGRHASRGHVLGDLGAMFGEDERHKTAARAYHTAVPFLNSGEGLKTIRLGLVTLATTSVFPTFLRRARRSAGVEEREASYVASSHYA